MPGRDGVAARVEDDSGVLVPDAALSRVAGRPRLVVILEQACLELYQAPQLGPPGPGRGGAWRRAGGKAEGYGGKLALLNCDDHQSALSKMGRDIAEARPDITHQCLLTLLDSPLNKAGLLQVYIHTAQGVWIEVNPLVRIPRTFKRFSGLMVQLLSRKSITSDAGDRLLTVISSPVPDYLPANTHKVTLTHHAPLQRVSSWINTVPRDSSLAIFIGAMAHGQDDFADLLVDEKLSISEYDLSAAVACGKVRPPFLAPAPAHAHAPAPAPAA